MVHLVDIRIFNVRINMVFSFVEIKFDDWQQNKFLFKRSLVVLCTNYHDLHLYSILYPEKEKILILLLSDYNHSRTCMITILVLIISSRKSCVCRCNFINTHFVFFFASSYGFRWYLLTSTHPYIYIYIRISFFISCNVNVSNMIFFSFFAYLLYEKKNFWYSNKYYYDYRI